MQTERNRLAVKGLIGWTVYGTSTGSYRATFSSGPRDETPGDCVAVDMSEVYSRDGIGASAVKIWKRPNLDLGLPDGNVRSLFEGCIGHEGTTAGHPWNGSLESLHSTDSVGLNVYLECLKAAGGKML